MCVLLLTCLQCEAWQGTKSRPRNSPLLQGVPVIQANGEAEATCAALNFNGLVDAVHSSDSDSLLFGASTVYRHMSLVAMQQYDTKLSMCRMSDVQKMLGIHSGGQSALMAAAQLIGGDYNVGGADKVGHLGALKAVKHLLADKEDDSSVRLAGPQTRTLLFETAYSTPIILQHTAHVLGRLIFLAATMTLASLYTKLPSCHPKRCR